MTQASGGFARLLDFTNLAVLAEIDPSYLGSQPKLKRPPKDMFFCVFGETDSDAVLQSALPEELRRAVGEEGAHGRPIFV